MAHDGRGTLATFTRIDAAPAGFEDLAPYVLAVADLHAGGRLMAWTGDSLPEGDLEIGMEVLAVPRTGVDASGEYAYYTLERCGGED